MNNELRIVRIVCALSVVGGWNCHGVKLVPSNTVGHRLINGMECTYFSFFLSVCLTMINI